MSKLLFSLVKAMVPSVNQHSQAIPGSTLSAGLGLSYDSQTLTTIHHHPSEVNSFEWVLSLLTSGSRKTGISWQCHRHALALQYSTEISFNL